MQKKIYDLPCKFGPLVSDWIINVRGKSAGEGITGNGQVVYGSQPRWEAQLNLAGFDREQVLTWRAIRSQMRGRVNVLRVCICDMYRPTWKEVGLPAADISRLRSFSRGVTHSDGSYFSDGYGYDQAPTIYSINALEPGDVFFEGDPTPIVGGALQPGHFFSYDDWLYQITAIEEKPDDTVKYYFEPPLRREIPAGAELRLEAQALMVFETDLEGRMALDLGRTGVASIKLQEWISRP